MCAEILECIQTIYFNISSDIETNGSRRESIHIELELHNYGLNNRGNHFSFKQKVEHFFSYKTSLLVPFYTGRNKDVFEFKLDMPKNKVLYIFIPSNCDNLHYDIKRVPVYLKNDAKFFKIFRKNLKELRIQ